MILTLDFETVFSDDYTLSRTTTEGYLRDPRFEPLCLCAVTEAGISVQFWGRAEIDYFLRYLPRDTVICAHHAHFDVAILNWHFGFRPAGIIDTLSMARLLIGNHVRKSLDSLARHYGLEPKIVPYDLFKGKQPHEIDAPTRQLILDGCSHDVELTWQIAQKLIPQMPPEEMRLIDRTVRMFTEPELVGDQALLGAEITNELERRQNLLASLGLDTDLRKAECILGSPKKFPALLESMGVELEYKQGKNGHIPALAASDEFMQNLVDGEDEALAALCEARLAVKSTIRHTRAQRMLDMAQRGPLAVYLKYCGAHSTRFSGSDGTNWQNLPRGSALRKSVRAPEGCKVIAVDLSQIEARIAMRLANELGHLAAFADPKRDPYCEQASDMFGRTITKADKAERQCGKRIVLSAGYGAGPERMWHTLKNDMRAMGLDYEVPFRLAETGIEVFRRKRPRLRQAWRDCESLLLPLQSGRGLNQPFGWPITVKDHKIFLPNGAPMLYELDYDVVTQEWRRKTRTGYRKIYGAALFENIVQGLARVVATQGALHVEDKFGLRMRMMSHDEFVWLVPEDFEQAQAVSDEMARSPVWMPDLPLGAEWVMEAYYAK